jgi:molybdate transport system permease protein
MSGPIGLSLSVAAGAVLFSIVPAIAVAWYLERSRLPGKGLVRAAALLPVVLPPIVTGYLLLVLLGPKHPAGVFLASIGLPVAFHRLGAVVAAGVVGFPFLMMSVALALRSVDPRLETVSRSLGLSRAATFARVTLPLAWPGILSGSVLCFARALGEFGATIVLAGRIPGETETIPLAVFAALERPGGEDAAWTLCAVSIALSAAGLLLSRFLERRI